MIKSNRPEQLVKEKERNPALKSLSGVEANRGLDEDEAGEIPFFLADKHQDFDINQILEYPNSSQKVGVKFVEFGLPNPQSSSHEKPLEYEGTSIRIAPPGVIFRCSERYRSGTLLKIQIDIPLFWERKQQIVSYDRIYAPETLRILAKVVSCEDTEKRYKRYVMTTQTLVIDAVDEKVFALYLEQNRTNMGRGKND